jgi:hypothetical protein
MYAKLYEVSAVATDVCTEVSDVPLSSPVSLGGALTEHVDNQIGVSAPLEVPQYVRIRECTQSSRMFS